MKACISQATTMGTPFEDDLLAFSNAGWPAVELWLTKLETFLQARSVEDARDVLDRAEIQAVAASSQGGLLLSQGPEKLAHWDLFARRLKLLEALKVKTLVVSADFMAEPTAEDLGRAMDGLAEASVMASSHGVRLALEFQKRARFCSSLDTAVALVTQVGAENLGICLDLFHYYTGPSKLEDLDLLTPETLAWVQVCDLSGTPRELAGDSDRVLPGDGDFQIVPIFEKLAKLGYDGYASVEILNPLLWAIALALADAALRSLARFLRPPEVVQPSGMRGGS